MELRADMASQPFLINLAPTGMVPTRAISAFVPLTPREIIQDVLACAELGITVAHLHARDEDLRPTFSKNVYARIIGGIRERRPDLLLCVSCSGRGNVPLAQRMEVLELSGDLKPDMASLTLSSLNFPSEASVNSPDAVAALASRMLDCGIKPELEIFDLGMANMAHVLIRRRLISPPYFANIFVGNIASAQFRLVEIGALTSSLPADTIYSLAGLGAAQLPALAVSAAAAAGARVGLEDNLWMDPQRKTPATNAALVEKAYHMATLLGRSITTPAELRLTLNLPPQN